MTETQRSESPRTELKSTGYELFIFLLSVLSISNIFVVLIAGPTSVGGQVAIVVEVALTPVFLFDFLYRLLTPPYRTRYVIGRSGWADLIAVVPLLRIFRLVRMSSQVREARAVGLERLEEDLYVSRASATFLVTLFLVVLVVEFAGILEYYVEQGVPNANIVSAGDSIWWGLVTITTVGYGDQYPVGVAGRLVGVLLLFAGIGLFSVLTGFIANVFLAPDRPRRGVRRAPGTPAARLEELRQLLLEQERHSATIRLKLHDLERAMVVAGQGPDDDR